jgi:ribose 5-phosphate isomerase B
LSTPNTESLQNTFMSILKSDTPIGIACDHGGFELKQYLLEVFKQKKIAVKDFGTFSTDNVDYADYAHPLALAVESGEVYPGIAICGSGNGINITLNKHQGIRSALCWNVEIASLARQHNDANICTMPGRFITKEEGLFITDTFLNTAFEGGRHVCRIEKIPIK